MAASTPEKTWTEDGNGARRSEKQNTKISIQKSKARNSHRQIVETPRLPMELTTELTSDNQNCINNYG